MRTLQKNKQKMFYANQTGNLIPVYERDSAGNIKYDGYTDSDGNFIPYLDEDGNPIPLETGEYIPEYSDAVEIHANISMGGSDTSEAVYGIDMSSYDATIIYAKNQYPLSETSVMWFQTDPQYKDGMIDYKSCDYKVVKIVDSLNFTTAVLKRNVK